jgi:hypothetical protein
MSSLLFSRPQKSAIAILGGRPATVASLPDKVLKHVHDNALIGSDEKILAGLDTTWTGSAKAGLIVSDKRVFRYKNCACDDLAHVGQCSCLIIRRLWYPGVPVISRGEFLGNGPIVVLRMAFHEDAKKKRLRLSENVSTLFPIVQALIDNFGPEIQVGRILPGL